MGDEGERCDRERAANDNGEVNGPDPEALRKVDAVVLRLIRIIGRRMAREDFAALQAANDNAPKSSEGPDGGDT